METLTIDSFKGKIFDFEKHKEWKFEGELPALIDFYADWCGPCRALSPILDELSKEYKGKINIFKIDTENTPELAGLFGVRSIPSLLFVPKTGEPAMSAGLLPKESLKKAISELLGVE